MKQYTVSGMSCAACSARVEKAVSKVDGVTSCSVSLLTNSMGVEGSATDAQIVEAVEQAGYGASPKGTATESENDKANNSLEQLKAAQDALVDRETPKLRNRLIASLIFLVVLMYFCMGHMMWCWPLPEFFNGNHVAMGLLQLLLTVAVMVIYQKFFISGFKCLIHGAPNMDTLVALGSAASFGYSVYALFDMTAEQVNGDKNALMSYMHEFYFEFAALILALITVGKILEAHSKGKTTDALKSLMQLAPKTATVVRDGVEQEISVAAVKKGDIFVVRPGENIPVDGEIIDGTTAVNESALTGESIPVDKQPKDAVSAATVNQSGFIKCRATRVGEDTTLSQIIQMVSDAAATTAPIAKIADRVSGVFVPAVITIAIITIIAWLIAGETVGFALARGISVLVISCPCALGLATPVAIMVGNGKGAKSGILFKTAASLEATGRTQIVALDKTGTITSGEPKVTDIVPDETFIEEIAQAAQLETRKHFGNSVCMFTPLYISNYCENYCIYCGFNCHNKINRAKLNASEIEKEMAAIAKTGLQEILILTGESKIMIDVYYIGEASKIARKYFKFRVLEFYPMNSDEYAYLHECGADYVTVFQETYNSDKYETLHLAGHKRIFPYRVNAQERAL